MICISKEDSNAVYLVRAATNFNKTERVPRVISNRFVLKIWTLIFFLFSLVDYRNFGITYLSQIHWSRRILLALLDTLCLVYSPVRVQISFTLWRRSLNTHIIEF